MLEDRVEGRFPVNAAVIVDLVGDLTRDPDGFTLECLGLIIKWNEQVPEFAGKFLPALRGVELELFSNAWGGTRNLLSDAEHFAPLPQGFRGFKEAGIVSVFGAVCDDRAAIFIHGLKSFVFLAAWVCAMST